MPKKQTKKASKKVNKKSSTDVSPEPVEDIMTFSENSPTTTDTVSPRTWYSNKTFIGIVVVGIALLGVLAFRKGMLVVATVNGNPIFRWNLDSVLLTRYGKQTLESMISEALIVDAARKAGVTVSSEELVAREQELVKSFGGQTSIDDLLKMQGVSREDFNKQLSTQIMVQKILTKDLVITDADVDNFISTASSSLQATDPAALRDEARKAIADTKVGEQVQEWYTKLRDNASIMRFIQ